MFNLSDISSGDNFKKTYKLLNINDIIALNEPTLYLGMLICSVSAFIFMLAQVFSMLKSKWAADNSRKY